MKKKMKMACVVGCMVVLMAGCKASADSDFQALPDDDDLPF